MKLLYLLNILFLVTPGLASTLAGPYQTVFFWYAYQLEVLQYGPKSTLTGKGCKGSAAGGGCYVCYPCHPRCPLRGEEKKMNI